LGPFEELHPGTTTDDVVDRQLKLTTVELNTAAASDLQSALAFARRRRRKQKLFGPRK